jgi:hypothetical protein
MAFLFADHATTAAGITVSDALERTQGRDDGPFEGEARTGGAIALRRSPDPVAPVWSQFVQPEIKTALSENNHNRLHVLDKRNELRVAKFACRAMRFKAPKLPLGCSREALISGWGNWRIGHGGQRPERRRH